MATKKKPDAEEEAGNPLPRTDAAFRFGPLTALAVAFFRSGNPMREPHCLHGGVGCRWPGARTPPAFGVPVRTQ